MYSLDEANRRVLFTTPGGMSGREATEIIADMVRQRPELIGWDWIQDVRLASGEVGVEDVTRVARAFAAAPPGDTFTVFVSTDPNLGTWARAMDFEFTRRHHLCAETPKAAIALLERHRATATRVPSSW